MPEESSTPIEVESPQPAEGRGRLGTLRRGWSYQSERFPLLAHGPLVAAFSFCALSYSSLLRGQSALPSPTQIAVAFVSVLIFFLMLRIADEFKDQEEDARYRPYRPVPRGLVTLRELGWIGVAGGGVQLGLGLWLEPRLLPLLMATWLYLALMSREFFVREWLKGRPLTYMWTHMLIMPLVDLYATACDWLVAGESRPPAGLTWFLVVSFFNGVVLEIGRKVRAPEDEEHGVETYTVLWGRRRAVGSWLGALGIGGLFACLAAAEIGFLTPVATLLGLLLIACAAAAVRFAHRPTARAKRIEQLSGVWTLVMYVALGALPQLLALWEARP